MQSEEVAQMAKALDATKVKIGCVLDGLEVLHALASLGLVMTDIFKTVPLENRQNLALSWCGNFLMAIAQDMQEEMQDEDETRH